MTFLMQEFQIIKYMLQYTYYLSQFTHKILKKKPKVGLLL